MNVIKPGSPAEVSEAVRSSKRLRPLGGGTKPALSTACEGSTCLDLSGLSGILEYDPSLQVNIINMTRVDLMASNTAYVPVD